jgi:hypothetical protein
LGAPTPMRVSSTRFGDSAVYPAGNGLQVRNHPVRSAAGMVSHPPTTRTAR